MNFVNCYKVSKHSLSYVPQTSLGFYIQFCHFLIMLPVAAHWPTQSMRFFAPEMDLMAPVLSLGMVKVVGQEGRKLGLQLVRC